MRRRSPQCDRCEASMCMAWALQLEDVPRTGSPPVPVSPSSPTPRCSQSTETSSPCVFVSGVPRMKYLPRHHVLAPVVLGVVAALAAAPAMSSHVGESLTADQQVLSV